MTAQPTKTGAEEDVFDKQERLDELYKKQQRTQEEQEEFDSLKQERTGRFQKKIDTMKSETLAERNARLAAEQRAEDAEKRAKDLEDKISKQARPVTSLETINVGDKSFYTDKALKQMVEAGQLTDEEAYNHQQDRIQEVAADRAYQRIKIEGTREEEMRLV